MPGGEAMRNLIILQADGRRYGLLASEILDILGDTLSVRTEQGDRAEIEGYAILGEETVVVLNIAELMRMAAAPMLPARTEAVG